eukprot:766334-Hanusia_phi.AAC.6
MMSSDACLATWLFVALLLVVPATANDFASASMDQDFPLTSGLNILSVTLVSNQNIQGSQGSAIFFSNLQSVRSEIAVGIEASGSNTGNALFAGVGWEGDLLVLPLKSSQSITQGTTYAFSLVVVNPAISQSAPSISIAANGSGSNTFQGVSSSNLPAYGVDSGGTPLIAFVSQFVPLVDVLNTILIQLKANCDIPAGSVLNVTGEQASELIVLLKSISSGLYKTGSESTDCLQILSDTYSLAYFGDCGIFVNDPGILETVIKFDLSSVNAYTLSFRVLNPDFPQSSPDVAIGGTVVRTDGRGASYFANQLLEKDFSDILGIQAGAQILLVEQTKFSVREIR